MITRQGKPAAVLISFEQWQAFQQAQQLELLPCSNGSSSSIDETMIPVQEPNSGGGDEQQSGQLLDQ